jgi:dolichyl-phosphate-mannose--protein O-mannosyl transferase
MFWSFSSGSNNTATITVEYYLHWIPRFDMSKQAFIYMRVINLRLYFLKGI